MSQHPSMPTVVEIADLSRADCQALWQKCFAASFPRHLSLTVARPILCFEMQSQLRGGLDRKTQTRLRAAHKSTSTKPRPALAAGSQLIRDWNGKTHRVEVLEEGFEWEGKHWHSLSAIAKAITGAHWSGPRFFGVGR